MNVLHRGLSTVPIPVRTDMSSSDRRSRAHGAGGGGGGRGGRGGGGLGFLNLEGCAVLTVNVCIAPQTTTESLRAVVSLQLIQPGFNWPVSAAYGRDCLTCWASLCKGLPGIRGRQTL